MLPYDPGAPTTRTNIHPPSQIGAERFRAPEILFDPEIIGLEYPGVHQIVVDSINRTDLDLRKDLYANIVLSGGSTLTKGFGDRLLSEVQRVAVKDMRIKIFAPPERKYSTWIGGSILAGLSTFRKVGLLVCWLCGMLLTCAIKIDVG
jgi:centractin